MKRIGMLVVCLAPLLATAQPQPLRADGVTVPAPVDRSIPTDDEGAHVEFRAVVSDRTSSTELGRLLSASDCAHRIEQAATSPEFDKAIHEHPLIELVCFASRQKA